MSDLPAKLEEIDRLKLYLSTEKQRRLVLEGQKFEAALLNVRDQLVKAQADANELGKATNAKYSLTERDGFNLDTGEITRSPVRAVPPAAEEAKGA